MKIKLKNKQNYFEFKFCAFNKKEQKHLNKLSKKFKKNGLEYSFDVGESHFWLICKIYC